jgi:DNA replication licensing factor MCM3
MNLLQKIDRGTIKMVRTTVAFPRRNGPEEKGTSLMQFQFNIVGIKIKVALSGPVGAQPMSPRSLTSSALRQLVCVEGVATKVSAIKPKVVKSVHYCEATKQHSERLYVDSTDPQLGLPAVDAEGTEMTDRIVNITDSVYPTKDKDGNPLETEFGLSEYKDHQTITLQEMPEKAPMGQLPRSVELVLDHDLVDRIKPGDRVMVVGVYRALAPTGSGQATSSGVFKTVVLVNNVQLLGRDTSQLTFSPQDIRMIKELGKRPDILSILGRSFSPSIHGHTVIKKALALQLLSGCEKNLKNGTHLRGDINILMVGDPSTAKSQLLRSAMTIAPLAVSTSGKGSSGVGLTAAVTTDPDTNERRLEAGAMVLADRGLVCIDEFDKMGENDRVAIHEAMEQQTVTIAKAGIHASLNARCSVLAAANPVFGQYDRMKRIQENIGLPDSLLSRFDLLFVVLDDMDAETDRKIANHVILGHRYRADHGAAGHDSDYDDDDDSDDEMDDEQRVHSVWQRNRNSSNEIEHNLEDPHSNDTLQHEFLRKYLHFAKNRVRPELTETAREFIANRYAEMRCKMDERTLPVTARTLETVIRLASAHAKARLSLDVEVLDCEVAMDILSFSLYYDNNGNSSPVVKDDEEMQDPAEVSDEGEETDSLEPVSKKQRLDNPGEDDEQLEDLKGRVWEEIVQNSGEKALEDLCGGADRNQLAAALQALEDEGRIMSQDGVVYSMD